MTAPGRQQTLEQRVLHFIREQHLMSGQQKLLVAVSGGPDSVCMLHILSNLQKELGVTLHVAHLNHLLRGAEAEADADFVADLARRLGIAATIEQRDVKAYHAERHLSLEEAAREVRYAFLAGVAGSIGADRAAVGHTMDDHVETILMHLIRGSGTRGLRGLQPISRWRAAGASLTIIRPLLPISREETASYCQFHQLEPRIDASNLSLSPLRNRIRHKLIPLLQGYNPRVTDALLRTARIVADDIAFIDSEAADMWRIVAREQENTITLDRERLAPLPAALKRHILRMSIEKLLGDLRDIEARHIEQIIDALDKPAGKRISLPGGLTFATEYNKYRLGPEAPALSPFPPLGAEFKLKVPGETRRHGWQIKATVISRGDMKEDDDRFTACFDFDRTGDKLTVRARQPGDRFQPLGMGEPKKLNEFMIDAKIPRAWRGRIPIVCSPNHILWIAGWRIDERVRVTAATRTVLRLKMERTGD